MNYHLVQSETGILGSCSAMIDENISAYCYKSFKFWLLEDNKINEGSFLLVMICCIWIHFSRNLNPFSVFMYFRLSYRVSMRPSFLIS
jgi:hypothetical protein